MKQLALGLISGAIFAILSLAPGGAADVPVTPDQAATPAISPTPLPCGKAMTNGSWGAATASDIRVQLLEVAFPVATPVPGGPTLLELRVTIENQGGTAISYRPSDFWIYDCAGLRTYAFTDGSTLTLTNRGTPSVAGGKTPTITEGQLAPGASVTGWLNFRLTPDSTPAAFVYRIEVPGQTGAAVGFPLASLPSGVLSAIITKVGSEPVPGGTPCAAAQGGNAIGGDAIGGNGADAVGGTAVGGSAVGGNGANGADAIGGSAVGCAAPAEP